MKKIIICAGLVAIAVGAIAGDLHLKRATVSCTTNGAPLMTATFSEFSGYIQEVLLDVVSTMGQAGATGTVTIAETSPVSTMANRTIVTGDIAGDTVLAPRFTATQGTGTATTNAAEPFMVCGGRVTLTVTNIGVVTTQLTYTAVIKYSDTK